MTRLLQSHALARPRTSLDSLAGSALGAAARLWFLTAAVGQSIFFAYLVLFYGRATARGDLAAWNQVMPRGHVPGDTAGNLALGAHLLMAALLTGGGLVQLLPGLRARAPAAHRWIGRIYLPTAVAGSLTGLAMTWLRHPVGDVWQHLGVSLDGLLILLCAARALQSARARRFDEHRRWAMRLFLAVSGVFFFRVGLMLWIVLNQGPAGFDPKSFTGPALTVLAFADSLLPLAVLELYLRAQRSPRAAPGLAVAAGLLVLTAGMGVGVFAATMGMWLPHL